jgi:hypothetical protein
VFNIADICRGGTVENSIKGRFVTGRGAAVGVGIVALLLVVTGIVLVSTSKRRPAAPAVVSDSDALSAAVPAGDVPAIDAAAPTETQTATFAMG